MHTLANDVPSSGVCVADSVVGVADVGLVVFFAVRSMLSTGRVLATLLLEPAHVKSAA